MTSWSKSTKILAYIIFFAVIAAVVFLFVQWQQGAEQVNPQEVLAELTLGEVNSSSDVNLPDPSKDATVSYVVASNSEVAAETGINIIMSKQEIIDYYTNWFRENDWTLQSSKQSREEAYIINAHKQEEGVMQINIFTSPTAPQDIDSTDNHGESEVSGPIQVLILYGYGR